jgi:hypothetical protein
LANKDFFQDAEVPTSAEIIYYLTDVYHARYMRRRHERDEPLDWIVRDFQRWCYNEENWVNDREKYLLEIRELAGLFH